MLHYVRLLSIAIKFQEKIIQDSWATLVTILFGMNPPLPVCTNKELDLQSDSPSLENEENNSTCLRAFY